MGLTSGTAEVDPNESAADEIDLVLGHTRDEEHLNDEKDLPFENLVCAFGLNESPSLTFASVFTSSGSRGPTFTIRTSSTHSSKTLKEVRRSTTTLRMSGLCNKISCTPLRDPNGNLQGRIWRHLRSIGRDRRSNWKATKSWSAS
jgi:hypothetical protein